MFFSIAQQSSASVQMCPVRSCERSRNVYLDTRSSCNNLPRLWTAVLLMFSNTLHVNLSLFYLFIYLFSNLARWPLGIGIKEEQKDAGANA